MFRVGGILSGVPLPGMNLSSYVLGRPLASVSASVDNHRAFGLNDLI